MPFFRRENTGAKVVSSHSHVATPRSVCQSSFGSAAAAATAVTGWKINDDRQQVIRQSIRRVAVCTLTYTEQRWPLLVLSTTKTTTAASKGMPVGRQGRLDLLDMEAAASVAAGVLLLLLPNLPFATCKGGATRGSAAGGAAGGAGGGTSACVSLVSSLLPMSPASAVALASFSSSTLVASEAASLVDPESGGRSSLPPSFSPSRSVVAA